MTPALRFLSAQHWAIMPSVFDALITIIERHDAGIRVPADELSAVRSAVRQRREQAGLFDGEDGGGEAVMQVRDGAAIIPIRGVIARYSDQVNGACQDQGRSAEAIQADLARAISDPRVDRIILRIDSPGGSVAGTAETGNAILAARASGKRVVGYVDGLAASAAYWLASQCDEIVASSSTALVGSIGVITAYMDASKAQEAKGYKLHIVRSVALKAPGTGNEKLDPEQLASISRMVGEMHAAFVSAVATGRGLDAAQMEAAGTGEVFTATTGMAMGLVDRIATFVDAVASRGMGAIQMQATVEKTLPSTNQAPAKPIKESLMPSSLEQMAELIAAHPAHAVLISGMAAKDASEEQIKAAVHAADEQAAKAKADAELVEIKAKLAAADARIAEANAAQVKAENERDVALSDKAALAAHVAGGSAGNSIKPDANGQPVKKITRDEFNANQKAYAADIRKGLVVIAD